MHAPALPQTQDPSVPHFTALQELKPGVTCSESGCLALARASGVSPPVDVNQVLNSRRFYKLLLTGNCLESNKTLAEEVL